MEGIKERIRTVYGVGYLGEGVYKSRHNGKSTHQYNIWKHMIERCYDDKILEKFTTYKGCLVCVEWLNFQNFAKWYNQNYYDVEGERMELDKDILIKGNKIYSPDTCIFVPHRINSLFTKANSIRGELPIGVTFRKKNNKYSARCQCGNYRKYIGEYNTAAEAFYAYKTYKENYVKQIAEEYKDKVPKKLYNAMITYEVEITD